MKKISLFVVAVLSIVFSFSVKAEYMIHNAYVRDDYDNIVGCAYEGEYVTVYGADKLRSGRTIISCGELFGSVLTEYIGYGNYVNNNNDEYTSYSNTQNYSIEVSISDQYIYLLNNGSVIYSSPCVTGNCGSHDTPTGIYSIGYKSQGAVLSGADYNVTVSYWMSFCGGIGIHDASWRDCFGGDIYTYNGSHGCVNVDYDMAQMIYSKCEVGTPVYVY